MIRTRSTARRLVAAAASCVSLISPRASAQTWINPNTGNWSTPANWAGAVSPVSSPTTQLRFDATGVQTYTSANNLGTFTLAQITANNNGTGTISLIGDPLLSAGTATFVKTGTGALSVTNALNSTTPPTFNSGGVWTVNGANVHLSGGGNMLALGTTGNSAVTVSGGTWTMSSTLRRNDVFSGINTGPWSLNIGETNGSTTTFTQTGGAIVAPHGFLNVGFNTTGTWTLTGPSTSATFGFNDSNVSRGRFGVLNGQGTINVLNGALLAGRLFEVARQSVDGAGNVAQSATFVNVIGANSRILAHQLVNRAQGGATINVSAGGLIDVTPNAAGVATGGGFLALALGDSIGEGTPMHAQMNISGPGSVVRAVHAQIGGELSVATINISNGGAYRARSSADVNQFPEATLLGTTDQFGSPNDTQTGFAALHVDGVGSTFDQSTPAGGVIVIGGDGSETKAVGGDATVSVTNGGQIVANRMTLAANDFSDGTLTISGANSSVRAIANASSAMGTIDVRAGGTIHYNAGTLSSFGTMSVTGGRVLLADAARDGSGVPSNKKTLEVGGCTISANGLIDLNDNDMIVHGGSITEIENFVATARNGGAWNAPALTSSAARDNVLHNTTLGVLSGDDFLDVYGPGATFNRRSVSVNDGLIKYTYYGDTDFSGQVDFNDYARVDNGFNNGKAGWFNGDFDMNGRIDFDDFALIDLAFNTQTVTLSQQHLENLQAVPEASSVLLLSGLAALAARRRKRNRTR